MFFTLSRSTLRALKISLRMSTKIGEKERRGKNLLFTFLVLSLEEWKR